MHIYFSLSLSPSLPHSLSLSLQVASLYVAVEESTMKETLIIMLFIFVPYMYNSIILYCTCMFASNLHTITFKSIGCSSHSMCKLSR